MRDKNGNEPLYINIVFSFGFCDDDDDNDVDTSQVKCDESKYSDRAVSR